MNRRALFTGGSALALLALHRPASAVCALALTPEERIDAALAEIKAALAEKYPDHFITGHASLRVSTGGVVVGAYPLEDYEARMHFHSGPLLAADAGCWRRG